MGSTQNTSLKTRLLQLECHFMWALNKNDIVLDDLLNRLEEQLELNLEKNTRVAHTYSWIGFVKFLSGSNTEALEFFNKSEEFIHSSSRPTYSPTRSNGGLLDPIPAYIEQEAGVDPRQIASPSQSDEFFNVTGNDCDKLLVVLYGDLAWLYYHMGNFGECERYLNKLSEIEVKYPSVPYVEVLGEKGWTFLKFSPKYYERAKKCFKRALEMEPDKGEWNAGLAIVLFRTVDFNDNLAILTAIDQLKQANATNPDDDVLKVLLASTLLFQNENSEAGSLVEQALEQSPNHPHVLRYAAVFFRKQGYVDRSIVLLKKALKIMPYSVFIHHQLGLCYKKKIILLKTAERHHNNISEFRQAQKQCINNLKMATKLKPCFIMAMTELAYQYGSKPDIMRAEELFQKTFYIAKEKNDNYQYVHLRYAEFQQYCLECEPAAIKHYTECLNMNPKRYEGRKSANQLESIAKKRIKNNPVDGEAFGILGIVYKEKGEMQQAIECFEKALSFVNSEDYLSYLCELRLSLQ